MVLLDHAADQVSAMSGLPDDQARFVLCMLASYPLGLMYSQFFAPLTSGSKEARASRTQLRHIVAGALGVFLAWEFMHWGIVHSVASSTVGYFLVRFLPRDVQHKVVFAFAMIYMSGVHIYRMYIDYGGYKVDFSGPQMMITIKLITFAFDYRDGALDEKDVKNSHVKAMRLAEIPSVLEYFGYIFNFCGFLAGPAVNVKEYLDWIDGSLFVNAPNKSMPNPIVPGFLKLVVALLCAVGLQFAGLYAPLGYAATPAFVENHGLVFRIFYIWIACGLCRISYYFAWNLSEGACIWAGLGFTDYKNGKAIWERATNVKLWKIETAQNFHSVTSNWNMRTNDWLKYYVAARVPRKWAVQITMATSATWHGFYPGYYLSFFTSGFNIEGARLIRTKIRPFFVSTVEKDGKEVEHFKSTKPIYDVISMLFTSLALNYSMSAFMLLEGALAIAAWKSVYFYFHGVIVLGLIALNMMPRRRSGNRPASGHSKQQSPQRAVSKKTE